MPNINNAQKTIVYPSSKDLVLISKKAVDFATKIAKENVSDKELGKFIGVYKFSKRVAGYYFKSTKLGYKSWYFIVSLSRKPFSTNISFNEINLVASDKTPVPIPWVDFKDRLVPSDIHKNIQLPMTKFDKNLTKGFPKHIQAKPNLRPTQIDDLNNLKEIVETYALSRERVLSNYGKNETYQRWMKSGRGKVGNASKGCNECGYFNIIQGTLGQNFGVCTNEWSNEDGKVVSFDHSCGAHSETGVTPVYDRYLGPPLRLDESIQIQERKDFEIRNKI